MGRGEAVREGLPMLPPATEPAGRWSSSPEARGPVLRSSVAPGSSHKTQQEQGGEQTRTPSTFGLPGRRGPLGEGCEGNGLELDFLGELTLAQTSRC